MLLYSLKNYLNYLNEYSGDNKYELLVFGQETNYNYKFIIHNGISVLISTKGVDLISMEIKDIEKLKLSDNNFTAKKLVEISYRPDGLIYEESKKNIYYIAQLYIKMFRLMRERVNFVFKHRNKFYYCYYCDGKILYIDETEQEYRIKGTDFFKLANTHPGYEILYVSPSMERYKYGDYLDMHHKCAISKGKKFVKYKYEIKVE